MRKLCEENMGDFQKMPPMQGTYEKNTEDIQAREVADELGIVEIFLVARSMKDRASNCRFMV